MCCLFGMVNYSGMKNPIADNLVNYLAQEATIRGMHSTGIAYNKNNRLVVYKRPKNAYEMNFQGLKDCACVMGHTRHATQGSYKKNYNNHPFPGTCENAKFALAHNGVLWNDATLRKNYNLPRNKVETDSYIAVQLLEDFGTLDINAVSRMAEMVQGSFTFTMIDDTDKLWIVKGDNPLSIIHFPQLGLYVYASTAQILLTAVCRTELADDIANGDFEMVSVKDGDILTIDKNGYISRYSFDFDAYGAWGYNWQNYYHATESATVTDYWESDYDMEYLDNLKSVARGMGFMDEDIMELYNDGYTLDEIEEFIYSFYPNRS